MNNWWSLQRICCKEKNGAHHSRYTLRQHFQKIPMLGHFTAPSPKLRGEWRLWLLHFHCHASLHECGVPPFLCNNNVAQRACELLGAMSTTAISFGRGHTCVDVCREKRCCGDGRLFRAPPSERYLRTHKPTHSLTDRHYAVSAFCLHARPARIRACPIT